MKGFKYIILCVLTILLCLVLFSFEINLAIRNTLLNSEFLSRTWESSNMNSFAYDLISAKIAESLAENPPSLGSENFQAKNPLPAYIDKHWLEDQVPIVMKGFQHYLTSDSSSLPILDIGPAKVSFLDAVVTETLRREDVVQGLSMMKASVGLFEKVFGLHLKAAQVDTALVKKLILLDNSSQSPLGVESFTELLKTYLDVREQGIEKDEIDKKVIEVLIKNKVHYDSIQNTLDTHLLLNTLFAERYNPVTGLRDIIATYKSNAGLTLILLGIVLILAIAVTSYQLLKWLRWSGISFIIASFSGLLLYLASRFSAFKIQIPDKIVQITASNSSTLPSDNLIHWWVSLFEGFTGKLLIHSLLLLFMGIVLLAVSFFLTVKKVAGIPVPSSRAQQRKSSVLVVRILLLIFLLAILPITSLKGTQKLQGEIKDFNTAMKADASPLDLPEALAKVIGAEFLMK